MSRASVVDVSDELLATVDEAGRFELALEPGAIELFPHAADHDLLASTELALEPGELIEDVRLVLAPTRTLSVEVVNREGSRLSGARIGVELLHEGRGNVLGPSTEHFGDWFEYARGRTRVRFEDVPRVRILLHLHHDQYPFQEVIVGPTEDEVTVDMGISHESILVEGRVIGPSSEPVPGARIRVEHPVRKPQVTTRSDGSFSFQTFRPRDPSFQYKGEVHLLVASPGYAQKRFDPPELLADRTNQIVIELESELAITGTVVDQAGVPVPRAGVWIQSGREAWSGFDWLTWADNKYHPADEHGRFKIGGLWEGTFLVGARVRGSMHYAIADVAAGSSDVQLQLGAGGERLLRIVTRVVDDRTGEPIERYFVGVRDKRGGSGSTHDAPGGLHQLMARDPGTYAISVEADGYARVASQYTAYEGGEHELTFRLRRSAPVRLRIVDPAGNPVAGVGVLPVDSDDVPIAFDSNNPSSYENSHPKTGYDGRCWFTSLPCGQVRLRLSAPDGSGTRWVVVPVALESADERELSW